MIVSAVSGVLKACSCPLHPLAIYLLGSVPERNHIAHENDVPLAFFSLKSCLSVYLSVYQSVYRDEAVYVKGLAFNFPK